MFQPTTNRPDLAATVARLFGLNQATVIHMPERRTPQRMTATLVALPTQPEIELDGTREAIGATRLLAHALASVIERRTGNPTTAAEVLDDARGLAVVFCNHYRGIATRRAAAAADEKVD